MTSQRAIYKKYSKICCHCGKEIPEDADPKITWEIQKNVTSEWDDFSTTRWLCFYFCNKECFDNYRSINGNKFPDEIDKLDEIDKVD